SSTVRNHDGACRQGFPHLMAFLEAHRGNLIALSNSCSPEDVVRLNLTFSSFPWANQMCVDFLVTKLSHTAPQTVQVTCTSQISNYGRVTSNFKVSPDGTGVPPVKPTPPNLPPNPPPNQNDRNPTGDWQLDGYSRSLEQYSGTWTRAKAAQLLNKIGFGATKAGT
ncbi:MAG: hypothetical protein NZO16_04955, partial [Deltaproteobacteria bacterium]|nr:hypothetical protein [Deltaproteobacteria bacterium]